MFLTDCTARPFMGIARVTLQKRPLEEGSGPPETGKSSRDTSARAALTTLVARFPDTARPTRPTQLARATASPSHPSHALKAPNTPKATVAPTCHTTFWSASSPTSHPRKKVGLLHGSLRTGR